MPYTRYIEINEERLEKLHDGLELMEMLDREAMHSLDLHVYGVSNNPQLLDAAREAIAESEELAEEDVQIAEVAVAIPISADTIYALLGSGIKLTREDFAYLGTGGEGTRTMSFTFAHYKPTVNMGAFTKIALASSESWLDDFLRKEGSGQAAKVTQNVHRTEEATQPGPAQQPAIQQQQPIPKQTSEKLSRFLDDFLD
jgi:hypothetical protein